MKQIVIFDLDGTLLNTIADLGAACNHALARCGLPTHAPEDYPRLVGNGINRLIERALPEAYAALGEEERTRQVMRVRQEFVPYYNNHNCDLTHPYEGITDVLEALKKKGIRLAVASNKYHEATLHIVRHFFGNTFDCVYGEREGIPRKPDPQIVRDILQAAGGQENGITQHTLYVGDSPVDIETARRAGVPVAACTWGFASREELTAARPDFIIDSPPDIIALTE
ncbi:MAG: HAD family hydrolase [Paludibacteraceae bacterium]|nr:HAD family hydrolase [Paludibacteraceae bacterium]